MTDQPTARTAELRTRIADTLATADGWVWASGFDRAQSPSYQGYLRQADAVLTALPADRVAEAQHPAVVPCMRPTPHPAHSHSGFRKGVVVHGRCPGADVQPPAPAVTDQTTETFDRFETPDERRARWEDAAHHAGREVDRNTLAVYLTVADAEQATLSDHWARSVAAHDAEIRRLKGRIRELERPAVEAKRAETRASFVELIAAAQADRDFEGAFKVECDFREQEERWAIEDATEEPTP